MLTMKTSGIKEKKNQPEKFALRSRDDEQVDKTSDS